MSSPSSLTKKLRFAAALTREVARGIAHHPSLAKTLLIEAADMSSSALYKEPEAFDCLPNDIVEPLSSKPFLAPPPAFLDEHANQSLVGLSALVGLAKLVQATTLFEIGTFNGLTAWCLSANLPNAVVHTLDIPAEAAPSLSERSGDASHRIEHRRRVYERLPTRGTVTQHLGDSAVFDFTPWEHAVDLIYVDGAHSLAYVNSDTDRAVLMASENSVIIWDDLWHRIPEVSQVLISRTDLHVYRVPGTRLACAFPNGLPKLPQLSCLD